MWDNDLGKMRKHHLTLYFISFHTVWIFFNTLDYIYLSILSLVNKISKMEAIKEKPLIF